MRHDTSWYIMIHHETSWYIMIHSVITSWYIMMHQADQTPVKHRGNSCVLTNVSLHSMQYPLLFMMIMKKHDVSWSHDITWVLVQESVLLLECAIFTCHPVASVAIVSRQATSSCVFKTTRVTAMARTWRCQRSMSAGKAAISLPPVSTWLAGKYTMAIGCNRWFPYGNPHESSGFPFAMFDDTGG